MQARKSRIITVRSDLLESKTTVIVHQCNCTTTHGKGLSAKIFERFPYTNIYSRRKEGMRDNPGEIILKGNGKDQRYVVNMLAQRFPGKPQKNDTPELRIKWFKMCLFQLQNLEILQSRDSSVGFPMYIGCGLAGGDWMKYLDILEKWSLGIKAQVYFFFPQ